MAKIGRPGLPSDKRQEVWERWRVGDSISEIARGVEITSRYNSSLNSCVKLRRDADILHFVPVAPSA